MKIAKEMMLTHGREPWNKAFWFYSDLVPPIQNLG